MTNEPRSQGDYGSRAADAARRVLIDLGQALGSYFADGVVVVGGWVPSLLIPNADEPHVGSIDVDLALNPDKLRDGRYAEIVKCLLATGRYEKSEYPFKLRATVDLKDGSDRIVVDVDFLKPLERRRGKRQRHLNDFRPLDADGCATAFANPEQLKLEGVSISGAKNKVMVAVASVPDFLIMKAYALAGRDKPKDAYDICYCLEHGGLEVIGKAWRTRRHDPVVAVAVSHLEDKFASVDSFGPEQVAAFYSTSTLDEFERNARRAFELVQRFLAIIQA